MPQIPNLATLGARPALAPQTWGPAPDDRALSEATARAAQAAQMLSTGLAQQDVQTEAETGRQQFDQWDYDNVRSSDTGARNMLGADAFQLPNTLPKAFDNFAADVIKQATNPRVKAYLTQLAGARRAQTMDWMADHVAKQKEVFLDRNHESQQAGFQQRVASVADTAPLSGSGNLVDLALQTATDESRNYWQGKAKLGYNVDQEVGKERDALHVATLNKLVADDKLDTAQSYLAKFGPTMGNVGTMLEYQDKLKQKLDERDTKHFVDTNFTRSAAAANPDRFQQMRNVQNAVESGNQQFNDTRTKEQVLAFEKPDGLIAKGNIDLVYRPKNAPVSAAVVGTDHGQVLIPTTDDSGKPLNIDAATALYKKTGKNLGVFNSPDAANSYASALQAQQNTLNKPVVSSKGAVGVSQILPSTGPEAAKLAGLPWDEQRLYRDPGYNKALGDAYLGNLVKTYGGDERKALAAYNWGPGNVDSAQKQADQFNRANPNSLPKDWSSFAPSEVTQYADGIVNGVQAGSGTPHVSRRTTLMEMNDGIEQQYAGNLRKIDMAQKYAAAKFDAYQKATKEAQEQAKGSALAALTVSGGQFTPEVSTAMTGLDPADIPSIRDYATKTAKGEFVVNNDSVFGMLAGDDRLLAQTNLDALRAQLDPPHRELLVAKKAKLSTGAAPSLYSATEQINQALNDAGIDPAPKKGDPGWDLLGQFRSELMAKVGPDPAPDVAYKAAKELTAKAALEKRLWWGGREKKFAFQLQPGDTVRAYTIPDSAQKEIEANLKQRGKPTDDATVQKAYRMIYLGLPQ